MPSTESPPILADAADVLSDQLRMVVVPSSAVETMGFGGMLATANLAGGPKT